MKLFEGLLFEDNAGDALFVGQALAECLTPFHPHIARYGKQAVQILGRPDFKPDLILNHSGSEYAEDVGLRCAQPSDEAENAGRCVHRIREPSGLGSCHLARRKRCRSQIEGDYKTGVSSVTPRNGLQVRKQHLCDLPGRRVPVPKL